VSEQVNIINTTKTTNQKQQSSLHYSWDELYKYVSNSDYVNLKRYLDRTQVIL